MKVLHVAQALARSFGGVQTVLHDLSRAQRRAGLEVDVVSTNVDAPNGVLPVIPNQFIGEDGVRFRYSSVQFRPLLFSLDLKRYLDRYVASYDIVHVHGMYRFPQTYAAYRARIQRVPYIIRVHGSLDPYLYSKSSRSVWLKRIYENWFDLPNLNAAGAIAYTAEEERERAAFLGLRGPSFVVPNGLDWEQYGGLPSRGALRARWGLRGEPTVLFLGRLHFKKGLDLLIPAFEALRGTVRDAQLVIAGPENDDYGSKVRAWVRERALDHVVHFVGPLTGADVVQAYVDADVFCLPSYTENFGMTVAEAMACALPVVISDQVNIYTEVARAGAGLVTHCDATEVAEALRVLLRDPGCRRRMGEAGRSLVQERYTWPVIVDSLTREYEAVIERHAVATGVRRTEAPLITPKSVSTPR
jgi:glycosyltransferase involved in cell wall biosynthesis